MQSIVEQYREEMSEKRLKETATLILIKTTKKQQIT
jgi:hypothetical protein